MTVTTEATMALPEHLDEKTEMELLRLEVYEAMCRVRDYRAGNTSLIEAVMLLMDGALGATENAQKVLTECGMLNGADGSLNWAALSERKDSRWTWEHCVRTLVKQPAEVARLLALGDGQG
ncbi:hypothetical protein F6X40_09900 [Paraburkholderia sp. UCT31]|uniref:hypothetical protein n=1 Tax=Paraburkholderia sp. UCT31 TaxID=2615209 RepID=UPI001655E0F6|nr:hypothetical protein [Paraburkholderia sp. UCT31]MBC8737120.1 hypothetical protein [Paraburkholderia sp. UCT31]